MEQNGKQPAQESVQLLLTILQELRQIRERLDGIEGDRLELRGAAAQLIELHKHVRDGMRGLEAGVRETFELLPTRSARAPAAQAIVQPELRARLDAVCGQGEVIYLQLVGAVELDPEDTRRRMDHLALDYQGVLNEMLLRARQVGGD